MSPPSWRSAVAAFLTSLVFFLQLRIADEFKDYEEDRRFRSYRPVPRGLVTLQELAWIGVGGAVLQLLLALALDPALAVLLAVAWLYLALMNKEFFARTWLKAHTFTYLWTHMLIMPLIAFYAMACDWLVAGERWLHVGILWFVAASFFNGMVIEIGRKIRAPADEEHGVETYSSLWGRRRAVLIWFGAMALTATIALAAALHIDLVVTTAAVLGVLLLGAALIGSRFLRQPATDRAKWFEPMSGLWTLLLYVVLGAGPLLAPGRGSP